MRWCYKTAHKLLILSSKIHIQKIISFCSSVAKLPVCWVVVVAPAVRIGMVLSCVVQSKVRDSATDLAADFGDVEVQVRRGERLSVLCVFFQEERVVRTTTRTRNFLRRRLAMTLGKLPER